MKKISILLIFTLFSCISIPERAIDDFEDDPSYEEVEINQEFLINSDWFIDGIIVYSEIDFNGDGVETDVIFYESSYDCYSDNFYVFNSDLTDFVTVNYGDILCNNEENAVFAYEFNEELETLKIPSFIENFSDEDGYLSLYDLVFSKSTHEDSTVKIIEAEYLLEFEGEQYPCHVGLRSL